MRAMEVIVNEPGGEYVLLAAVPVYDYDIEGEEEARAVLVLPELGDTVSS